MPVLDGEEVTGAGDRRRLGDIVRSFGPRTLTSAMGSCCRSGTSLSAESVSG